MHLDRRQFALGAWIVLVSLFLDSRQSVADSVLYQQPSNFSGGVLYASQNDTGGFIGQFATAYDNFTPRATQQINEVKWQGGYFLGGQVSITSFTITFWSNVGNNPGVALLTISIPGTANETFVGNEFDGLVYNYDAVLGTPFAASAGTTYWLSIVPNLIFPSQWGWHSGTAGDGVAVQDFFGARSDLGNDLAFSLIGAPEVLAPEPSALLLIFTGLLGIVGFRFARGKRLI